ncbi:MAG: hypothetical protein NWE81_02725 [Candidatus Bathyarchaeota archaeon]|nr:hypothetical protein [Candidatus Bathyarchaeota archaeon]
MKEKSRTRDRSELRNSKESKEAILEEPRPIEISSGFSLAVSHDKEGRQLIHVRKYGEVDVKWVRREIERSYPGAIIHGLGKRKTVEVHTEQSSSSSLKLREKDQASL